MLKRKSIGELSQTRATWYINPVSKVKQSDKVYDRKKNKKVEW